MLHGDAVKTTILFVAINAYINAGHHIAFIAFIGGAVKATILTMMFRCFS
jgi:hypothetical protein